jgi:hypothetical protein
MLAKTRIIKVFTIIVLCADLFIAIQISGAESIYTLIPQAEILDIISHQSSGFPLPPLVATNTFTDDGRGMGPFWKNTSIIRKETGFWGYNPFKLKNYVGLAANHPNRYRQLITRPAVFLTASSYSLNDSVKAFNDSINNALLFNPSENAIIARVPMKHASADTFEIKSFGPNRFAFNVQSQFPQLLCVLQSYYPGWEAHINGSPATIYMADACFVTVQVPKGLSEVTLEYRPKAIYIALIVACITWLFVIGYLLWVYRRINFLKP